MVFDCLKNCEKYYADTVGKNTKAIKEYIADQYAWRSPLKILT